MVSVNFKDKFLSDYPSEILYFCYGLYTVNNYLNWKSHHSSAFPIYIYKAFLLQEINMAFKKWPRQTALLRFGLVIVLWMINFISCIASSNLMLLVLLLILYLKLKLYTLSCVIYEWQWQHIFLFIYKSYQSAIN